MDFFDSATAEGASSRARALRGRNFIHAAFIKAEYSLAQSRLFMLPDQLTHTSAPPGSCVGNITVILINLIMFET